MIVEKIELGYWTKIILERQDQVLPVYVFSGTAIFEDGHEMWFVYPVPATNLDYPPLLKSFEEMKKVLGQTLKLKYPTKSFKPQNIILVVA